MTNPLEKVTCIDGAKISKKRVLLRIDMDVACDLDGEIVDDTRVRESLGTIELLLKNENKVIVAGHLGRPKGKVMEIYSAEKIVKLLAEFFPENEVTFVSDFMSDQGKKLLSGQKSREIVVLENMRFWPEERDCDEVFCQKLAELADVYVNNAFGTAHREHASTYGVAKLLPGYSGLDLHKQVSAIQSIFEESTGLKVAILGGGKLETKLRIEKMLQKMDYVLVGGIMANTFLHSLGHETGKSKYSKEELDTARETFERLSHTSAKLVLPSDAFVGDPEDIHADIGVRRIAKKSSSGEDLRTQKIFGEVVDPEKREDVRKMGSEDNILDIGPETQKIYADIISQAGMIFWNGPLGYYEHPKFQQGSDAIYSAIIQNTNAYSVVGGGDTLGVLSGKRGLKGISHISTGGGAMLDLIAQGTLPALEALRA